MKRLILFIGIVIGMVFGCNQFKNREGDDSHGRLSSKKHHPASHRDEGILDEDVHTDWKEEIQLDNAAKWNANPETTGGIAKMSSRIEEDRSQTIASYKALADDLNGYKNYIIRECTMTGASHDNLHIYLFPLMKDIERLVHVRTTEEGSKITRQIRQHLEAYYDYFK